MNIELKKIEKGRNRIVLTNNLMQILNKCNIDISIFELNPDSYLDVYIDGKFHSTIPKIDIYNTAKQAKLRLIHHS